MKSVQIILALLVAINLVVGSLLFSSLFCIAPFCTLLFMVLSKNKMAIKLQLALMSSLFIVTYFIYFNFRLSHWELWASSLSILLQLYAWAYLCRSTRGVKKSFILDLGFVGSLLPIYLSLRSVSNVMVLDRFMLMLMQIVLSLMFLHYSSHSGLRMVRIKELLVLVSFIFICLALSFIGAQSLSQESALLIPKVMKNFKNPQGSSEQQQYLRDRAQYNEQMQSQIAYSNDVKLQNSFDLKESKQASVKIKILSGNQWLVANRIYLKCRQYDQFINNKWFSSARDKEEFHECPEGLLELAEGKSLLKYEVSILSPNMDYIPMLGRPLKVKAHKILLAGEDLKILDDLRQFYIESDIKQGLSANDKLTAKRFYHPITKVEKKVYQLTKQLIKNISSKRQRVEVIKNYLQSNFQYSRSVDNPVNMDPLENFLFYEKKGHCVLFSTAFSLMLRYSGIASNLCSGYYGGEADQGGSAYTFYSNQAHTWVELKTSDGQWVIVDPTPKLNAINSNDEQLNVLEVFIRSLYYQLISYNLQHYALFLILICGLPFLVFWSWKFKKKYFLKYEFVYLKILYKKLNKLEPLKRGESLAEYYARLCERDRALRSLEEIISYTYKVKYDESPRDKLKETSFLKLIKRLKV